MQPSTVVVVSDYASVNGGNGKVALFSAIALARSGIKTILFAATGPVASELRNVPGLDVVCMDKTDFLSDPVRVRGALRGLWEFDAAARIRNVLRQCDRARTVVHVHSWTKALSSSVVGAALDLNYPVVMTLHDYFAFCPNGSLYDHQKQAPCPLKPMSVACVGANCDPRSRLQKAYRVVRQVATDHFAGIPSGVKYFICVSSYSRKIASPNLGSAKIFDVANPIDVDFGARADPGASQDFLYVGRLSREKGIDIFALAARLIDAKAILVGDGPFREIACATAPEATYTGWLDANEVREHLRSARALVLPSRWHEASPLVVAEAAAVGVPAIVSDQCAAAESIVDGVTGVTFRSGDVVDLAAKIKLLSHPEVARTMGFAAYTRFWANPPLMDRHLQALREVYSTILAERSLDLSTAPRRRSIKS